MHGIGLFDPNMGADELMSEGVSSLMLMPHIRAQSPHIRLCYAMFVVRQDKAPN